MNIIKNLTGRIEDRLTETKNPCKNYATEDAAEVATSKMATMAGKYFTKPGLYEANPTWYQAHYVVFYVPSWNRWVGAINLTELVNRSSSTGGYLGICKDFYTW
jgi:hypothetical protein